MIWISGTSTQNLYQFGCEIRPVCLELHVFKKQKPDSYSITLSIKVIKSIHSS